MIYDELAKYYDALVQSDEATKAYIDFVLKHIGNRKEIMEVACGSGEIACELANQGRFVDASDLSASMLKVAKAKDTSNKVHFEVMDMRQLTSEKPYDALLCFCDSLNYLQTEDLKKFFEDAYKVLDKDGMFLFDMHASDRLKEFEEEYYEAGNVEGVDYIWSIVSEENFIYHSFVFYDDQAHPHYENHMQQVFDEKEVHQLLIQAGFEVEVYTDFDKEGIQAGEKYFYVCRKGSL